MSEPAAATMNEVILTELVRRLYRIIHTRAPDAEAMQLSRVLLKNALKNKPHELRALGIEP
jgi:hypothetical protein